MRTLTLDGNFSAEHMKMRRPLNDVSITDGTGFFVADTRYKRFLQDTIEAKLVSSLTGV